MPQGECSFLPAVSTSHRNAPPDVKSKLCECCSRRAATSKEPSVNKETEQTIATRPRRPGRLKSLIGIIVAVLSLAGLGGLAWYLTHQPEAGNGQGGMRRNGPPPSTVGVATVENADIPVIVESLGTVTASAVATVRAQVSGVLKDVLFKEGQMVKAGQVLAVIDPRQFEMALMQATGQRQRDEAQLENAKQTLARYRTLLEQDSIARQDVDAQAALVKQLEGTVTADRATEGTARLNLGYTRIEAPISGRVGLRAVDVGNVVNPGDANGVAVITQTAPIDVQFSVPQDQIPELLAELHEGVPLKVNALDRSRETVLETGRFLAMDNQVDPQTGTVKAKARFDNAKNTLFPSQFVNVRLLMRTVQGATVVPVNAVRHGGNGDYVYVLNAEQRTVALRPVKRGLATVDKVQIVSGLKIGEQVITEGADRLRDGAKVMLPGDKMGAMGGGRKQGERGAGASGPGARQEGAPPAERSGQSQGGERRRRQGQGAEAQ
ncbi:efflux RND transporter periplasmic adaptor subunit [Herbaspirillum sp. HC18]|nr:efflux RND transporter periplasmic adaptor subunit [Herbaspirillum sp. HC18]